MDAALHSTGALGGRMKVLGFSHYNLRAPRELLDTLRAFYVDVVGLKCGHRPPFSTFGYWLYAGEQAVLHLSEASGGASPAAGAPTNFDHAAFNCMGRREFETRLAQLSVKYHVAHVPQTKQIQLFLKDPAGNGVELNFTDADA
ncbi:MAG TPA: hypothetical protein VK505_11620 [Steroidobacteraceae bacterium]|jgi:catechol-2,3-dioxygenase|nr:hypothetical protein [Steroidobacteraceae bacterium]